MSLKKLFFLSTVIFLIGHMNLFAQSEKVNLSGTIQDAKSGETLPFVVVNIKDLNLWTTSDINGKFSFKDVKKGEYTLTASCLGYKDYEMKIYGVRLQAGRPAQLPGVLSERRKRNEAPSLPADPSGLSHLVLAGAHRRGL